MQGTQIQATMFNESAKKFYDRFQLGKAYYISKGTLRVANKQFKTVANDYEMTLNENSMVEEASEEGTFIPETKFNFIPIDQLGPYVNNSELVGMKLHSEPSIYIVISVIVPLVNLKCQCYINCRCYWCGAKCISYNEYSEKK